MWNTLGMSGGWRTEAAKHSHVELKTTHGSVFFTDARNFGTIRVTDSEEETKRKINSSFHKNKLNTGMVYQSEKTS